MNSQTPVQQQLLPPGTGLVSELDLGSGRGARSKAPVQFEFIRALAPSDLPAIQSPQNEVAGVPMLKQLRSSHHRLAELIASGRPPQEVSIVTGYSPSYISALKGDPAFNELVAYYEANKKLIFADAMERLKSLGLDAIEKLHERLNDDTKPWSNKELMDLVDMSLVAPTQTKVLPGQGGAINTANLNLEVKFVGVSPKDSPVTIDANFTELKGPN